MLFTVIVTNSCTERSGKIDILATVGEQQISIDDLKRAYIPVLLYTDKKESPETREEILSFLIDQAMLAQEARALKLDTLEALQTLKRTAYKTAFTRILYKDWVKDQTVPPSESELRTAYQRSHNPRLVRHLFVPERSQATKLHEQLMKGADWDSLAQLTFNDPTLASNGGILGWMKFGDMDPGFEEAVYTLDVRQLSQPVRSSFGWHIIRVDEEIKELLPTEYDFALERKRLARILEDRQQKRMADSVINQLMLESNLTFNPEVAPKVWNILAEQHRQFESGLELREKQKEEFNHTTIDLLSMANEEMLRFNNSIWTVQNFLEKLPEANQQLMHSNIKTATAFLVRDEIIYEEGLDNGLDQEKSVVAEVNSRIDQYLSNLYLRVLANKNPVSQAQVTRFYQENAVNLYQNADSLYILEFLFSSMDAAVTYLQVSQGKYDLDQSVGNSYKPEKINLGWFQGARPDRPDYYHRLLNQPINTLVGPIHSEQGVVLITAINRKRSFIPLERIYDKVKIDTENARLRKLRFEETRKLTEVYDISINQDLLHSLEFGN